MAFESPIESTPAAPGAVTAIDDSFRSNAMRALMALVVIEPIAIVIVLLTLRVPWWVYVLFLGCGTVLPALVVRLIVAIGWNPNARRWPGQPVLPGAVSKSWQSFAFGRFHRFNNCMTIVADERCLHLVPFAPMRMAGGKPISLPLDRMTDLKPAIGGFIVSARLDGRLIFGPAWCMSLAQPESSS